MFMPIDNIGILGVVTDIRDHELPANAWSDAWNLRFEDNAAKKFPGHREFHNPALGVPWAIFPVRVLDVIYFVYLSLTSAHAVLGNGQDSGTITRVSGPYSLTPNLTRRWQGDIFNGIPYFNNGIDNPQVWLNGNLGVPLIDLPNWPANTTARIIRPFSTFLVGFDITKNGTRFPFMMKWSHSADPGTVPSSWDETDPSLDAGERPLDDNNEYFVDMWPLADTGIIYREGSTWGMRLVQNQFIFATYKIFDEVGLLAQDCARNFARKQFAVTPNDVVVHDGVNAESVIDLKRRRELFNRIDTDFFHRSMVVPLHARKEMWFCYPEVGGTGYLTRAEVWNWALGTWTSKELPADTRSATSGPVTLDLEDDTWDGGPAITWDSETAKIWDITTLTQLTENVVIGTETTPEIFEGEQTFQFDGVNYRSYLERKSLPMMRPGPGGVLKVDMERIKQIQAIWPRIIAAEGTEIEVHVGWQETLNDEITWLPQPLIFTVGVDQNVQPFVTGRLLSLRFEETRGVEWELQGYTIEFVPLGRY